MGVSLRNLMARMGHDNERAALLYQHRSNTADRTIADGLDALVRAQQGQDDDDEDGAAGVRSSALGRRNDQGPVFGIMSRTWAFGVERVTGIEPALSAWENSSKIDDHQPPR
jgi:hypothetical protein